MRTWIARTFWTFLAAVFLVEAWIWDVLGGALSALVARLPIEALRRSSHDLIERMPATFALGLFVIPMLVILPFKLVGVALIAKGRIGFGCAVFLLAKTAGVGVTAFIFDVCRSRLMTLRWFERFYAFVMRGLDWAHRQVAPYRAAIIDLRMRLAARLSARSPSIMSRLKAMRARARAVRSSV
jgi:hypothetical protein